MYQQQQGEAACYELDLASFAQLHPSLFWTRKNLYENIYLPKLQVFIDKRRVFISVADQSKRKKRLYNLICNKSHQEINS